MASLVGCLACGACNCCAGQTMRICAIESECNNSHGTRIGYFVFFILSAVVAFVVGTSAAEKLHKLSFIPKCNLEDNCFSNMLITKMMFGAFVFHLLLALVTIAVKDKSNFRARLHNGWWPLKAFLWLVFLVASVFIPNKFFTFYSWVALVGACLFVIYQLILIIDLSYNINSYFVEQIERTEEKKYVAVLLGGTIVLYLASIGFNVLIWVFLSKGEPCQVNIGFSVANLIACFVVSILSITPKIQQKNEYSSSIFTSAVVTLYACYLVFSAVLSEPESQGCNFTNNPESENGQIFSIVVGLIINVIAVGWSTVSAAGVEDAEEAPVEVQADEEDNLLEKEEVGSSGATLYNYSRFHVIFAFGIMYMSGLLTNWQILTGNKEKGFTVDQSMASVWMKIISGWLMLALYTWTIINSFVCPDRKFR